MGLKRRKRVARKYIFPGKRTFQIPRKSQQKQHVAEWRREPFVGAVSRVGEAQRRRNRLHHDQVDAAKGPKTFLRRLVDPGSDLASQCDLTGAYLIDRDPS